MSLALPIRIILSLTHYLQWTHAEGPVTVYMARCPASCSTFDGSGAVWFKIDEAGLLSGTVNKGSWGNGVILSTLRWTTTIPATLAPGNYLIRVSVPWRRLPKLLYIVLTAPVA